MARTPNYKKWKSIYIDFKDGLTWNQLVKKHKTSKGTISKAINFYEDIGKGNVNLNDIKDKELQLSLAYERIFELQEKAKLLTFKDLEAGEFLSDQIEVEKKVDLIKTQQIMEILESLNNLTRLRLVMVLLIYNELSLDDLSKKLGFSKSTVSRHLGALRKTGIIKIRKEKVRGPRMKQYISVTQDLLQMARLGSSMLRKISPEKALEARILDLKNDMLIIRAIKNYLSDIIVYYMEIQKNMEDFLPKDHNSVEKVFSSGNVCRYYFWNFNEQQFEIFKAKYLEFFKSLKEELEKCKGTNPVETAETNPYFVWHLTVPIKKVYDKVHAK